MIIIPNTYVLVRENEYRNTRGWGPNKKKKKKSLIRWRSTIMMLQSYTDEARHAKLVLAVWRCNVAYHIARFTHIRLRMISPAPLLSMQFATYSIVLFHRHPDHVDLFDFKLLDFASTVYACLQAQTSLCLRVANSSSSSLIIVLMHAI